MGGGILPSEWASKLENAVFDEQGRPSARNGWKSITTTPGSGTVMRFFEYYTAAGASEAICSTDANIYDGLDGTFTAIEGALTITDGNIQFVNFNDKVIAFGIGAAGVPAVRTSGNFASITVNSGTAPTGTIGTAAFGRIWGVDTDGKTLRYSALLDETRWDAADGGGSIDFSKVWPSGQDDIVAVTEFAGDLVVFGSTNTVIMTDGQGTALGIDPTALYVSDTIPGVGAISQFAMCRAAGDFWFLTPFGVVGLSRELQQKSTPFNNLSQNVQSNIIAATTAMIDTDDITMMYNPNLSIVLVIYPDIDTVYCFDTRAALEGGAYRASTWTTTLQTAAYIRGNKKMYGSLTGTAGTALEYSGYSDSGTSYYFDYESGWMDLGEQLNIYLKFVKRLTSFVYVTQNVSVTHSVKYDFNSNSYSLDKIAKGTPAAQYGSSATVKHAEYGASGSLDVSDGTLTPGTDIAEYGGGVALRTMDAPLGGGGQYIKTGLRLDTSAGDFILQQINLYAKIGRLAT
jgi:hypothetical protein